MKPRASALVPFLVFAVFYVGLSLYARNLGFDIDSLSLIKSLYYQPLLALAVMVSILLPRRQKAN